MASTKTPPRYFWWVAALIVLIGAALRLWQLGSASLWYDEVLTEMRAQAPMSRFFTLILDSGNQTPLYFATLHLVPTGSEFWLRLPSAACGVAGIVLLMFVTLRLYGNYQLALLSGALLSCNPYHVWLSRTARPYALLFVLALLASYFFLLLLRGDRSRGNWAGFTLSSMAAYLTHYFAAALPLAQYVLFAFILRGNRGFFRRWLRAQIIAGIPLIVWVFALMRQETVAFGIGWIPRPGPADIVLTFWNMLAGYDGSLPWYLLPSFVAGGVGLIAGLVMAVRERQTERANFYWFWLIVAPLVVAFVVSLFRPLYVDRYFMVFLPAVIVLTVQGWLCLPVKRWRVPVTAGLAGLLALSGTISVLATIRRGDDVKEDWRAAAVYVEQYRQPGDALLLETPITLVVFLRYFEEDDIPRAWLLDAPPLDEQYGAPVNRVWAIYRNPNDDGHRQGVLPDFDPFEPTDSPLSGWLIARRDAVVMQQEFNGVTVLLVAGGEG